MKPNDNLITEQLQGLDLTIITNPTLPANLHDHRTATRARARKGLQRGITSPNTLALLHILRIVNYSPTVHALKILFQKDNILKKSKRATTQGCRHPISTIPTFKHTETPRAALTTHPTPTSARPCDDEPATRRPRRAVVADALPCYPARHGDHVYSAGGETVQSDRARDTSHVQTQRSMRDFRGYTDRNRDLRERQNDQSVLSRSHAHDQVRRGRGEIRATRSRSLLDKNFVIARQLPAGVPYFTIPQQVFP